MKKLILFFFLIPNVSFGQSITKVWEKYINGSIPDLGRVEDIIIDNNYIVALSKDEISDIYIKLNKFTLNGDLIWSKKWDVKSTDINPYYIQKSNIINNYYVLGYAEGGQPFITQFDSLGNVKKVKVFTQSLNDFKALKKGGFIVLGQNTLIKINENLDILWSKSIEYNFSNGICCSNASSIDITNDDNIYVLDSGTSMISNTSAADIVVAKLDSTGNLIWNKFYGGSKTESISNSAANYRSEIKAHIDGGFVLECNTRSIEYAPQGVTSLNEVLIIKGDKDGKQNWWATSNKGASFAHGLKIKPNGNILLYGSGSSSASSPFASVNDKDATAFISELDYKNGNMLWGSSFGGNYDDSNRALAIVNDNTFIVGGTFLEGTFDAFAWIYQVKLSGVSSINNFENNLLTIYPNPTTGQLNIKNFDGANYQISNMIGEIVESGNIENGTISFEKFPSGIYQFSIIKGNNLASKKIIKF